MTFLAQYPPLLPTHYIILVQISTVDVLRSFHFGFRHPRLYNCIPTTLQHDLQVTFHFLVNKLAYDPYKCDKLAFVCLFYLSGVLICPFERGGGGGIRHKEMRIPLKCFLVGNWEKLQEEIFYEFELWHQVRA
jgi:hypothetical protein